MDITDLAVRTRSRLRGVTVASRTVPLGNGRLLTRTRFGHRLFLDADDTSLTPSIALRGVWEPGVTSVFRRAVRRGDHVVEIGANVGWYTLQAAELVGSSGSVVAFEPNPRAYELLHLNLLTNGLWPVCRLERTAVAARAGRVTLHVAGSFLGSGRLAPFGAGDLAWQNQDQHSFETVAVTLDQALGDDGPIDVLKMDVEGGEPAVLDGAAAVLDANPLVRMIVEYHPHTHGVVFLERLQSLGFRLRRIDRWGQLRGVGSDLDTSADLYCDRA